MIQPFCYDPQGVILGGGDFPTHPIPLSFLQHGAKVVCCDGAAVSYLEKGYTPWRIVGDGDSLSPAFKEKFAEILRIYAEQETNDQSKAVRYFERHGFTNLCIVGGTGKREDHTIGNIAWLVEYLHMGLTIRMYTDHGVFIPMTGTETFQVPVGTQVSVFNFGAKGLCASGLQYPLSDFSNWWQGTLNQAQESTITISAQNGAYLVYFTYEVKK